MSPPTVRIRAYPLDYQLVMLGFDTSKRTTITDIYAKQLREAIMCVNTDALNEEDIKAKERSEQIKSEYRVIWK